MTYVKFGTYNIFGGLLWVTLFLLGGYFFGQIPMVRNNFSLVVFLVIIISVVPVLVQFFNHKKSSAV